MKNLQIRCQEGSVYYDAVEALGAYAQSVAFSELYSALQSGVEVIDVDVAEWQAARSSVYDTYGEEYMDIIEQIKATEY